MLSAAWTKASSSLPVDRQVVRRKFQRFVVQPAIWHGVHSKKPEPHRTITAFESEVHQRRGQSLGQTDLLVDATQ